MPNFLENRESELEKTVILIRAQILVVSLGL